MERVVLSILCIVASVTIRHGLDKLGVTQRYIYTRRKDHSIVRVEKSVRIMPTYAELPGVAGIRLAVCRIHTILS